MKWFNGIETIEDLKKAFRKLVMKHHPDVGGDTATMQSINAEFDEVFERLSKAAESSKASNSINTTSKTSTTTASETAAQFRAIIEQLIMLDNITIEIVGYG